MIFEDYDVEFGYSFSDLRRGYSRKAYEVPDYDLRSLEEIELRLASPSHKYSERVECLEHLKYLEDMQKRLSMIALAEEREGVMNWELRGILERVKVLTRQIAAMMERLPEVVVYKLQKGNETQVSSQKRRSVGEPEATATYSEPLM